MPNHPFFVYGTLRPGQANHARLLAGRSVAEFSASLPGHVLYGPGLPYAAVGEEGAEVVGDVIVVAPGAYRQVLADLDRLEGYRPGRPSHYERVARPVRWRRPDATVATTLAWVYLAGPVTRERLAPDQRIASGDWLGRLAACGR